MKHTKEPEPQQSELFAWVGDARRAVTPGRLRTIATTVADQGLVSLAGFLIHILLARTVAPQEYGVFVLAYSVIIVAYELHLAVLLEPMMVFGSNAEKADLEDYLSTATMLQIGFTCGSMVMVWAFCSVWFLIQGPSAALTIVAFMPFGLLGVQSREFVRRAFFTRLDPRGALQNDLLYVTLIIGSLVMAIGSGRLHSWNAFLIIGLAGLVSSLVGLARQGVRPEVRAESLRRVTKQSWKYGRWMIAAAFARSTTGELYYYVVALFTGPTGAGALRAIQNLFAPISLFLMGIGNLLLPVAARLVDTAASQRLGRFLFGASVSLGVITIAYVVPVALGSAGLIEFAYAGKYGAYAALVPLVGLGHVLVAFLQGATNGLRALNKPRAVFSISMLSAVASTLVVFPLTARWGIEGAVTAWILSLAIAFPFWTRTCVRAVKDLGVVVPDESTPGEGQV